MSEAAQNSVKYVESIESLSTKNDVRKFQRDVSVISPALLSNVETSKTSFMENGKKVFRVTVEANFDEDHSRQIKKYMDAVGHQTNLMHDLMVTQDEIKNINYRLESLTGSYASQQAASAWENSSRAMELLNYNNERAKAIISPLLSHDLKKQFVAIDEIRNNERNKAVLDVKQKEYQENILFIGMVKMLDHLKTSGTLTLTKISFSPMNNGKYLLSGDYNFVFDSSSTDELCNIMLSHNLAKTCSAKTTRSGSTVYFQPKQNSPVASFKLTANVLPFHNHLFTITSPSKNSGYEMNIGGYGKNFSYEISQQTYDELKRDPQSISIQLR